MAFCSTEVRGQKMCKYSGLTKIIHIDYPYICIFMCIPTYPHMNKQIISQHSQLFMHRGLFSDSPLAREDSSKRKREKKIFPKLIIK